jgi:hypothetical protein
VIEDPEPEPERYLLLMDPDPAPGGPKTYGSDGSGFGSAALTFSPGKIQNVFYYTKLMPCISAFWFFYFFKISISIVNP